MKIGTQALAADLRVAADWLDKLAERVTCRQARADIYLHGLPREELAAVAREMPGVVRKEAGGEDFWVQADIGVVKLTAFARSRDSVCTRNVVGTRHVPAEVIPAHDEEIVEWDCGSLLAEDAA